MNWISVGKDEPVSDEAILIYHIVEVTKGIEIPRWSLGHYYGDNQFLDLDGCVIDNVTHWCEITEPSEQRVIPKVPQEDRAVGK